MSIHLRSTASASAAADVGTELSATSVEGDIAVLVVSAQLPDTEGTKLTIPAGWDGNLTSSLAGKRAGYIAKLEVSNPSQTTGIKWWPKYSWWTARCNAELFVFSGAKSVDLGTWTDTIPTPKKDEYILGQTHAAASVSLFPWDTIPSGTVINDGTATVSTEASWSALRAIQASTDGTISTPVSGQGQAPSGWVTFNVTAKPVEAPKSYVLSVFSSGKEQEVSSAKIMPFGASSVDDLLSIPNFVVAHRGGSANWHEHTQNAYTNAVAYGTPALEISCGRTTGGVWFGCHDKTLERLGGPATPVAEMNWASIQTAMKDTGYMPARLDWLLATYGNSHVIMFDPKYEAARYAEYLPILEPYKDNVILKYSGDAAWLFKVWKAAGFKTWGYSYPSNTAADWWSAYLKSTDIDILSMQWDAPKATWDALKATGKPVTSHIPTQLSQITTAQGYGAVGTIAAAPAVVLTKQV